ncbi:MAG: hypothetical protein HRT35_31895 [Algicola sp.]|nr:hypothetical protein [Algicola sp.]
MKIFLSVGATYNEQQESFVRAFEDFLVKNSCERLTVGRGNYRADQPIYAARELMQSADAVIVLAFTRLTIEKAIEKPGSENQVVIENRCLPTVWNQLEAAMAFGLNLPILIILEQGLHQEAMLKDRHEFRVIVTEMDSDLFTEDEFKGTFVHWVSLANKSKSRWKFWNNISQNGRIVLAASMITAFGVILAAVIKVIPELFQE